MKMQETKQEEILEEGKETVEEVVEETSEEVETVVEENTEDVTEQKEASEEKKGFFKKKKDKKDEKIEELTDQVKRQMAEFENFRKRTEKEKTQMFDLGAKSVLEKILPVVDNFERVFFIFMVVFQQIKFITGHLP